MTRERSIRLHAHEVRAVLSGAQTQVRRVLRPQPPAPGEVHRLCGAGDIVPYQSRPGPMWSCAGSVWAARRLMGCEPRWRCPWGEPGDLMWVQETWSPDHATVYPCPPVVYRADGYPSESDREHVVDCNQNRADCLACAGFRWRPSVHLQRRDSRLTLRVTQVRVERLQDISEEDARAEGCGPADLTRYAVPTVRDAFRYLWDDHANKGTTWADNPWVWAMSFEVAS